MLTAPRLTSYPGTRILFLAPTKPLAQQHLDTFRKILDLPPEQMVLFTGNVASKKRVEQFAQATIIFSTPQGFENDLMSNRIRLDDVSLVVFDEAHRAVGDYSYVYLAKRYHETARNERILALTASPGSDKAKIEEVATNLFIDEIEVRSEEDPDVSPYIQDLDITWVEVPLPPELKEVQKLFNDCYQQKLADAQHLGHLPQLPSNKSDLLRLQGELHGEIASGNRDFDVMKTVSVLAEALKVQHALELLETQGIGALTSYLEQLGSQARAKTSKATVNLMNDPTFKAALLKIRTLVGNAVEHPKLKELKRVILKETYSNPGAKLIVFTQYRDQAVTIEAEMKRINVASKVFVGQAKKKTTGLSQKEQKTMLEEFSHGDFSVLIATSVAEEGLDIPKVDAVVFYEPVPSAIRTVQRRGRTGRLEKGKVIFLVTKGTRDVGYRWVAHHKERRMYRAIKELKHDFLLKKGVAPAPKREPTLASFDGKKTEGPVVKVIADHREKGSAVLKSLLDLRVDLDLQQLGQLRQYTRPILVIEGTEDLFAQRAIHPNAIRGMLATIMISYNIPLIMTRHPQETAQLLVAMARREQEARGEFQFHSAKPLSEADRLVYTVASIPGIGNQLARPLLERFRTLHALTNASVAELAEVPLIGEKKAQALYDFFRREYKE